MISRTVLHFFGLLLNEKFFEGEFTEAQPTNVFRLSSNQNVDFPIEN